MVSDPGIFDPALLFFEVLYVALCISCVVLLWNDGLCFHDTPFMASVLLYNITFFPLATLYIQRYHKFLIRMEIEEFNVPALSIDEII